MFKRLSHSNKNIPDAIPVDPNQEYPDHFIVVAKEIVDKTRKLFAKKKQIINNLHIYTEDSGVENKLLQNSCRSLDYNVLYRHHLNKENHKYYPIMDFEDAMQRERLAEARDIFQYIKAYKVNIHYKSDKSTTDSIAYSASTEGPLGNIPEASIAASVDNSHSSDIASNRDSLVFFENEKFDPEEEKWPMSEDPLPSGWFFIHTDESYGGFKNTFLQLVTTTIQRGKPQEKKLRMEFCATDSSHNTRKFMASAMAEFAKMSGVGLSVTRDVKADLQMCKSCTFDIEFFDQDVYRHLKRASMTRRAEINQSVRMSLSSLATLRFKHYGIQPQVREDLIFRQMSKTPANQSRPPQTWREFLCGENLQAKAFTVNIPLTIYGPAQAGKSSVIDTWDSACNLTPFSYMENLFTHKLAIIEQPSDHKGSIHRDTKFDASGDLEHDASSQKAKETMYRTFEDYHSARIMLRDTLAATGPNSVSSGAPLPLGLQILVLDAIELEHEHQSGTTAYLEQCTKLIGPPVKHSVTNIAHYPPICILLAKSNSVSDPESLVTWTKDKLQVSCPVFAMPTYKIPTEEEREVYLNTEPGQGDRKIYDTRWKEDAYTALTVLGQVLSAISLQECTLTTKQLQDPGMLARFLNGEKLKSD